MKSSIKFYLLLTIFVLTQGFIYAQSKSVKWEAISGKNDEFMVSMPAGYLAAAKDEFYLGMAQGGTRVEKQLSVAREINGVVLVMDYYQGKGKDIYSALKQREKSTFEKEETVSGFQIAHFSVKTDKGFRKTDYYFNNKSLYILRGFAKSENDKIVKSFFDSVRLVNKRTVVAPNVPQDAKYTSLLNFIETETPRLDDSLAITPKDADRPLIILKATRPRFSFEARQGLGQVSAKLKVLYSSTGKVSKVEVLEITSKSLERESIEAAKDTIFIPAEKDGKLVSVYQTIEYSFGIETR